MKPFISKYPVNNIEKQLKDLNSNDLENRSKEDLIKIHDLLLKQNIILKWIMFLKTGELI